MVCWLEEFAQLTWIKLFFQCNFSFLHSLRMCLLVSSSPHMDLRCYSLLSKCECVSWVCPVWILVRITSTFSFDVYLSSISLTLVLCFSDNYWCYCFILIAVYLFFMYMFFMVSFLRDFDIFISVQFWPLNHLCHIFWCQSDVFSFWHRLFSLLIKLVICGIFVFFGWVVFSYFSPNKASDNIT